MSDLGRELPLPNNGDTLTLVADGGNFGILVTCPDCEGNRWLTVADPDTGEAMQEWCGQCSGSGWLHQQWHPVGDPCRRFCDPPKPEGEPDDIAF